MLEDTIAAISTPLGKSGIGMVRMSGPSAIEIAGRVFYPRKKKGLEEAKSHTVHYGMIKDGERKIDEVLVVLMRKPHTYTCQDMVEISCHGGPLILKEILELMFKEGARLALPGEFTMRGFLNGRMDLTQAEAVLDLINAKGRYSLSMGMRQLEGQTSGFINGLRGKILEMMTLMESGIEFPEDVPGSLEKTELRSKAENIIKEIQETAQEYEEMKFLKEGIKIAVAGKTNTGKSSLINIFLREERNIVSSIEGTTRDVIEAEIILEGIPVSIVDTAGFLEERDEIERMAIQKTKEALKNSHLVLLMLDTSVPFDEKDKHIMQLLDESHVIVVMNKIDLTAVMDQGRIPAKFKERVSVSCKTQEGIEDLKKKIKEYISGGVDHPEFRHPVFSQRHIEFLAKTKDILSSFVEALDEGKPEDFLLGVLKEAQNFLDRILGTVYSQDLLDNIFSRFCIGK